MKFQLYQIVITAIATGMIFQGAKNLLRRKRGQTILKLAVRVIVWGGMALIALFPSFTFWLANTIGITGNVNAAILTGFILVFLMIFKLLSAIERLEQQISGLTEKETLDEIKK